MEKDIKQQILIALAAIEAEQYDSAVVVLEEIVERLNAIEESKRWVEQLSA